MSYIQMELGLLVHEDVVSKYGAGAYPQAQGTIVRPAMKGCDRCDVADPTDVSHFNDKKHHAHCTCRGCF